MYYIIKGKDTKVGNKKIACVSIIGEQPGAFVPEIWHVSLIFIQCDTGINSSFKTLLATTHKELTATPKLSPS